jgi:multisubunit Na+/H+ antiporter MnhB subunit
MQQQELVLILQQQTRIRNLAIILVVGMLFSGIGLQTLFFLLGLGFLSFYWNENENKIKNQTGTIINIEAK